jgi:2-oxoglutarate dehydrogenase E2 component (dihydrolipoamide succinyltransferase)
MATTSAIDVVMPQMGVSVSEGTITKWLKQEGEPVAADESLLEISTDKVDTEVPSPGEGILQQILVQEGETVDVGTKLAVIAPEGAAAAEAPPAEAPTAEAPPAEAPPAEEPPAEEPPPAQEAAPPAEEPVPEPATAQAAAEAEAPSSSEGETPTAETVTPTEPAAALPEPTPAPPEPPPAAVETDGAGEKTFVSPVVARIAAEHGVDVDHVSGTGRGGRVTKKDILAFVESGGQAPAPSAPVEPSVPTPEPPPAPEPPPTPEPPPPAAAPKAPPAPAPQPAPVAEAGQPQVGESFEPMNAMRRGIAEHMRRSLDTSAHVTSAIEVDMSNVVAIRKKLKPEYEQSYGVNPTYLSFIARATVDTLRDYPWINGELRGDQIVTRSYVNLGFAVELADGKGLIVPVVRNAEGLNLLGMARSISEIAARAREKKLLPDDVQGGTFTITNPGGYGTFHGTPVISQPQAAILGTYAVVKRPWVIQDDRGEDVIAIRPIMNLTLTYDHRLVDGALAGRFLRDLREKLETWDESSY